MLLQKWNFDNHVYEPFDSPAEWPILYTEDMRMKIQCTNCGNDLIYGESFTSRTIHTPVGLGYPVCDDCYQKELQDDPKMR